MMKRIKSNSSVEDKKWETQHNAHHHHQREPETPLGDPSVLFYVGFKKKEQQTTAIMKQHLWQMLFM